MTTLSIFDLNKKQVGELNVNEEIAQTPYHPYLIKDAVVSCRAQLRQGTHATKTRSQVAGSTRKLWKQKGTGRARVGSVKSPIWRHGGIVFGPQPRDHSLSMNKKSRKHALRSALAEKIRSEELMVVDHFNLESHKTKEFQKTLDQLGCTKALIVTDQISDNLRLASRNLENVSVIHFSHLNVYSVLKYPVVLFVKDAFHAIEQRLAS